MLDKTGTVTTGRMALVDVHVTGHGTATTVDEALRLVGSVEAVGAPDRPGCRRRSPPAGITLGPVDGFANHQGLGVQGVVDGHAVVAGRERFLADCAPPADLAAARDRAEAAGRTTVVAGWDGAARAVLVVADTVKPTSPEAIDQPGARSPPGADRDNERAARAVAPRWASPSPATWWPRSCPRTRSTSSAACRPRPW